MYPKLLWDHKDFITKTINLSEKSFILDLPQFAIFKCMVGYQNFTLNFFKRYYLICIEYYEKSIVIGEH